MRLNVLLMAACILRCANSVGGAAVQDASGDAPADVSADVERPPSVDPDVPRRIVQIATGRNVTAAVDERGIVWMWGAIMVQGIPGHYVYNLERCTTETPGVITPCSVVPLALALPEAAVSVRLGQSGVCAVLRSGRLVCSSGVAPLDSTPVPGPTGVDARILEGLTDVTLVRMGSYVACAVWAMGARLSCWTTYRELGARLVGADDGQLHEVPWPMPIHDLAVGDGLICALGFDGRVGCWGSNDTGVLGEEPQCDAQSPSDFRRAPHPISDLSEIASITTHGRGMCVRGFNGSASCWGEATYLLPTADEIICCYGTVCSRRPREMVGGPYRAFETGYVRITCGIRADRSAWCNDDFGTSDFLSTGAWVLVSSLPVAAVAAGSSHICLLDERGEVSCLGRNTSGQLGDGSREGRGVPVAVRFPWVRR